MPAGNPKEELAKALTLAFAEAKTGYVLEREGDSLWIGEDAVVQMHEEKRRTHIDIYFHMDLLPGAAARVAQVVERVARAHGVETFVQEHFTFDEKGDVVYESELPECKVCGRRHPPEKPEDRPETTEGLYA